MANQILIRNSQDLADGPTELVAATPSGKVGELAVNTSSGLLFMGADPAATTGTATGVAVAEVADYFAAPMYTVADTHTIHGSSLDDSVVISGAASKPVYTMENAANDATGGELKFNNSRAVVGSGGTGVTGDTLGTISFYGQNAGDVNHNFASIIGKADSVLVANSGDETGKLSFNVMNSLAGSAAAMGEVMTITGGAAVASSTVAALGHLTVAGDLTVSGTTTTVDTTNLVVKDKLITLNDGGNSTSGGVVGIEIEENATPTGYVKTNANGDWTMLGATGSGSAKAGVLTLDVNASKTITVAGALSIEADSIINQDLSSDASWTSAGLTSTGAVVFGSDGSGVDVTFHSGTGSDNMLWDASEEQLVITGTNGATALNVADGNVTIADTLTVGTFAPATLTVSDGYDSTGLTVAAGGAVTTNGTIHADGNITTEGSFIIGSASMSETDLEKLDGITNGTAAASKALVLDASKDIGTIRNLTINGTFSDGNYTFDTSGNVSSLGTVGCGAITSTGTLTVSNDTNGELVGLVLYNQDDDADTAGAVSMRFDLEDTAGTAVDAGKINVKQTTDMTGTASTQDTSMTFSTSLNGTLTEYMVLDSNGALTLNGPTGSTGSVLHLNTQETTVVDGDVLGAINWTAPAETGTDALTLAGAIEVVAEGTFAADNNATEMVFKLGSSEAALEKMTLSSGGNLSIDGALTVGTDLTVANGGTGLGSIAKGCVLVSTATDTLAALDGGGSTDKILTYSQSSDTWSVSASLNGGTF